MKVKSIKQAGNLEGKKVFLRADLNVPIRGAQVRDDYKIIAVLPTIRYLIRYRCKLVIATHLGDAGKQSRRFFSTKPVAKRLGELLGVKVRFISDCLGREAEQKLSKIKKGEVAVLENLRFYRGEEENEQKFARSLSRLADIYVNDAFAASHRAHASVSAIKKYLPSYAGLFLEKEVLNLTKVLQPTKPLVVVIGGAKTSTKLPLLKKFLGQARCILVGGVLANVFLASRGFQVGKSLAPQKEIRALQKERMFFQKSGIKKIVLPLDAVVSDRKDGSGKARVRGVGEVRKNEIILDIGPKTIKSFARLVRKARTIVWNGPMGKFEAEHFRHGTVAIGRVIAARSSGRAFGVVGGGETIEALKMTKMMHYIDWVSTGGGAMLAFLAGEKMPGLERIVK